MRSRCVSAADIKRLAHRVDYVACNLEADILAPDVLMFCTARAAFDIIL